MSFGLTKKTFSRPDGSLVTVEGSDQPIEALIARDQRDSPHRWGLEANAMTANVVDDEDGLGLPSTSPTANEDGYLSPQESDDEDGLDAPSTHPAANSDYYQAFVRPADFEHSITTTRNAADDDDPGEGLELPSTRPATV